jgi:hypothetical protein
MRRRKPVRPGMFSLFYDGAQPNGYDDRATLTVASPNVNHG